jgi:hypothetical protein
METGSTTNFKKNPILEELLACIKNLSSGLTEIANKDKLTSLILELYKDEKNVDYEVEEYVETSLFTYNKVLSSIQHINVVKMTTQPIMTCNNTICSYEEVFIFETGCIIIFYDDETNGDYLQRGGKRVDIDANGVKIKNLKQVFNPVNKLHIVIE